ncbi:hypothetical protein [Eubacterium sp. 1001713B170207_170306_E7]|uniref:hypothetical protein n=1 Tax=Eubacterium sp. 1001713B170207_170306_E7 TaxID=2787097 RepID=UPI00189B8870|nr:hypothetical protein [Eubacterium sp. 1001713B170207_170306_E7]
MTRVKEIHIYKAKRKVGGDWIIGFPLIIDDEWYIRRENDFKSYKIIYETLCRCTGKRDVMKELLFEHDYIESMNNGLFMEICYGEYLAYCPADEIWLPTIGFYAKAENYKDMPVGELPDYALRLHNKFDDKGEENENSKRF